MSNIIPYFFCIYGYLDEENFKLNLNVLLNKK